MFRPGQALFAAALLCATGSAFPAFAQSGTAARVVVFHFTPTERAQIAIWIEKPDGTFLSTVGLTRAVSYYGIGNRPGATQMNSGYHWPYGRREGVLPIWAHRRAAAPGAGQFPRVIFQARPEGYASRSCEDSTPDAYFCLPFSGNTQKDGLDAISCASPFNSDKGRFLNAQDLKAGYAEPVTIGGQHGTFPLSLTSLYPPRRDVTPCKYDNPYQACGTSRTCYDHTDITGYGGKVSNYPGYDDAVTGATPQKGWGFAEAARRAMPDIDAVTMATPPSDQQDVLFSIPDDWAQGDYVAWLEINTEGDYNNAFNESIYPTPGDASKWDSWALTNGYAYRGQPSVVFSVPFTLGASGTFVAGRAVGYGSVDGLAPDAAVMHAMDSSISDDPIAARGSGADRLLMPPAPDEQVRLAIEVRDLEFCANHLPPEMPAGLTVAPVDDPKHSHEWGRIHFVAPAHELPIAKYEVRTSTDDDIIADFTHGQPALAASRKEEALMVPVNAPTGDSVSVDFGGLKQTTHYWVAVRAVDVCNRVGPPAIAELTTTKTSYTQLSGCFVATAAWGSAMGPEVSAMRLVRDRLRAESSLFAVATELYARSGPAAADVLRRSDLVRALARQLIGPLGSAALATAP
jgi:hypothetical protein